MLWEDMADTIAVIANTSLALSAVIALIFGIVQIRSSERDRQERFALGTLQALQTREFAELLNFINSVKVPTLLEEQQNMPDEDKVRLIQYGQQMESLGLMVAYRLIDLEVVDKTLGVFVTTSWKRFEPLFSDMREKIPDPYLAEYYQWLAERLEEYQRQNPREPFYKQSGYEA